MDRIELSIWFAEYGKKIGLSLIGIGLILMCAPIIKDMISVMWTGFWEVKLWGKAVFIQIIGGLIGLIGFIAGVLWE